MRFTSKYALHNVVSSELNQCVLLVLKMLLQHNVHGCRRGQLSKMNHCGEASLRLDLIHGNASAKNIWMVCILTWSACTAMPVC